MTSLLAMALALPLTPPLPLLLLLLLAAPSTVRAEPAATIFGSLLGGQAASGNGPQPITHMSPADLHQSYKDGQTSDKVTLPGDILLGGLFPIHMKGEYRCGYLLADVIEREARSVRPLFIRRMRAICMIGNLVEWRRASSCWPASKNMMDRALASANFNQVCSQAAPCDWQVRLSLASDLASHTARLNLNLRPSLRQGLVSIGGVHLEKCPLRLCKTNRLGAARR